MSTYSEKLKHPKWQKKRLEILQRDEFKCCGCLDSESTLHVHHNMYLGKEPWDTPNECLETLCDSCHEFEHELSKYTGLEQFLFSCVKNRDSKELYKSLIKTVKRIKLEDLNNG
jgi:hypothetical protein